MEEMRSPTGLGPVVALIVVVMIGTTAPNALWPLFQDRLGISATTVTLVFAAYASAVIVALVAFGGASDRIGRRPLVAGAVGTAGAASLLTVKDGLLPLVGGRVLAGISVGMLSGAATAYLVELRPEVAPSRGVTIATAATMGGLAAGPLLAGAVAEWSPSPIRAPFVVHLGLLGVAVAAAVVQRAPETVVRTGAGWRPQRPVVPRARRTFIGAALAGFSGNAQLGLYAALAPTFLVESLGRDGVLLAGSSGALLFAAAGASQLAGSRLQPATSLRLGMALVAVGSLALVAALELRSLSAFLVATVIGGAGGGLGFGGGLALANDLASAAQRSAVASTWFVVTYLGLVVPVVGAGRLTDAYGSVVAAVVFGGTITAIGLLAASISRISSGPSGPGAALHPEDGAGPLISTTSTGSCRRPRSGGR